MPSAARAAGFMSWITTALTTKRCSCARSGGSRRLSGRRGTGILCFLHYPPLYQGYYCPEILRLLREYKVKQCYYGHLHGQSHRRAIEGPWNGTDFSLVSADYLQFVPKKIDLDTKKCGN